MTAANQAGGIAPRVDGAEAALDRVLSAIDVQIDAFAVCEVSADAEICISRLDRIEVHYVVQGKLFLAIEDAAPMALAPGSVVIVPPRLAQRLAGSECPTRSFAAQSICSPRTDGLQHYDGTANMPVKVQVLCGQIDAGKWTSFRLFAELREAITADLSDQPLVMSAMMSMRDEIDKPGMFSRSLTGSLMKTCLVILVRRHLALGGSRGLTGLFCKPWLAKSVAAIFDAPAEPHTVASLAAWAGRGRAAFAKEFAETFGIPPMEFVTEARLNHAHSLLVGSSAAIADVAAQAGFASRSHFSRLFRANYGTDPTSYRRLRRVG